MPRQAHIDVLKGGPGERPRQEAATRSFLRMVSHELRTPLNSIIGFSEILTHELCGPIGAPQYKEYANLIGVSGRRLLALVNQVLEIVRLENGAADLQLAPEPLESSVRGAFAQLTDEAEAAGVRLAVQDPERLADVLADPRALQTVMVNLLQNAIAHSPPGGFVWVRAKRDRARVRIEVQDQGCGVPAEDLERIMRPFEQGDQSLTRSTGGAGLGLPIASLLCDAMGGGLQLRSPAGQGLTAVVTLPAA